MSRAITRDEAIRLMCELIDSGLFSEEIENNLADIMNAIENERYGLHMWGADNDEYDVLVTVVGEEKMTNEYRAEGKQHLGKVWRLGLRPLKKKMTATD